MMSAYKFVALNVLLVDVVAALGFREKKVLQSWLRCDLVRTYFIKNVEEF